VTARLVSRQTASRSYEEPLLLVNGGAGRPVCPWLCPSQGHHDHDELYHWMNEY